MKLYVWMLVGCMLFGSMDSAYTMPAKSAPITVVNSDGSVLTIVLRGDENCHFYTTLDGVPVVQEEGGDYRLAPELADSIQARWKEKRTRRNERRMAKMQERRAKARQGAPMAAAYQGKKRGIVILANFSNLQMKSANSREAFLRQFNEVGYHEDDHYGSVHDYFYDQSYGRLDLEFDVFGPVTVSQKYGHYGANNAKGEDLYVAELAAEVCQLADEQYDITWSNYDWDGDREVDQVYIIYAGYGENNGAPNNTVWPHEWTLSEGRQYYDGNGSIKLGGCIIDTYAMSCELRGTRGSTMNGIGTACHEFSHCLGFPDFYDTSYSGGFGMNSWDLMDVGSYNGKKLCGECPSGFTAYERWYAGWLTPTELDSPATITDMPALQDTAVAYIIYNNGNKNEYFMLENRQNRGWFRYTYNYTSCHGLLVTHVDYNARAWRNNELNNTANHQRMSIIPAGGEYGTYNYGAYEITQYTYMSHLFPGWYNVTELTNASHSSAGGKLFNQNTDGSYYMNKPITEIEEKNGLISFKFMGGKTAVKLEDITNLIGLYLSTNGLVKLSHITALIDRYLEN